MMQESGIPGHDFHSGNGRPGAICSAWKGMFLASLFIFFLLPSLSWSQAKKPAGKPPEPPANPNEVRINVGVSTAKPEDIIDIPITLSAPDTAKIAKVVENIGIPKKILSLNKTELGLAGEQSQAEVKTDIKDDSSNPDQSNLEVTIAGKGQLKPGILVYLKFTVAATATKGVISLKVLDSKAIADGGGTVETAKGKDGEVNIFNKDEEIPVVGCFFFNH